MFIPIHLNDRQLCQLVVVRPLCTLPLCTPSGCFREELVTHAYCRISSYLQTMTAMGYNPLVVIQLALARQTS